MIRSLPLTLVFTITLSTLVGCGGRQPAATPLVEPAPLTTAVTVAERVSSGQHTELAGTVAAARATAIASRVMALVTAVHVDLGDQVTAGQTLISIDPSAAQGQVSQARGALAQASAALTMAERNLQRFTTLAATNSASELEVDQAKMAFEQAKGAVEQARGGVAAAESVARESRVVAPFAGRIAARLVEVGDLAAPGRPLAMLESEAGRRLEVAVPETLLRAAGLAVRQELAVTLDAEPGATALRGRVVEISPGPDPAIHAYTVRVDLPGSNAATGAAGRVLLPSGQRDAILIPREALVESGGLTLVVVRDDTGRAQSRVVTTGRADADGRVEVLSGLEGGETLAVGLRTAPATGTPLEVLP